MLKPQVVESGVAVAASAFDGKISLETVVVQPFAAVIFTEKMPAGKPIRGFEPLPADAPQSKIGFKTEGGTLTKISPFGSPHVVFFTVEVAEIAGVPPICTAAVVEQPFESVAVTT